MHFHVLCQHSDPPGHTSLCKPGKGIICMKTQGLGVHRGPHVLPSLIKTSQWFQKVLYREHLSLRGLNL